VKRLRQKPGSAGNSSRPFVAWVTASAMVLKAATRAAGAGVDDGSPTASVSEP
jgi:hypothetical protein